jgi:hypothetical protein
VSQIQRQCDQARLVRRERRSGNLKKYEEVISWVRNPSDQSSQQVGSEPCDGSGNDPGDA